MVRPKSASRLPVRDRPQTCIRPLSEATMASGHDEKPRGSVLINSAVLTSTDLRTRFRSPGGHSLIGRQAHPRVQREGHESSKIGDGSRDDLQQAERPVEFIDNPKHRRSKLVQLTRKGVARYREMSVRFLAMASIIGGELDETEIRRTSAVVRHLSADVAVRLSQERLDVLFHELREAEQSTKWTRSGLCRAAARLCLCDS